MGPAYATVAGESCAAIAERVTRIRSAPDPCRRRVHGQALGCEMGYAHRILKYTCPQCRTDWKIEPQRLDDTLSYKYTCDKCGALNRLIALAAWPDVERTVYLGHDNLKLLKVHPVAPGTQNEPWAAPYSVRSFLYQASRHFGGCYYTCRADNWL